ncbi:hypothetical protein CDAR_551741 [Caerostris darwini]|uniref:Uncharacterized protein n=1 Tax=Caerostris darwini TaxID=1538125 RepID=A0AAV4Q7V6_9ARAC|nr:hypothetical protein CDAR_551741 [Caerostris darwini]
MEWILGWSASRNKGYGWHGSFNDEFTQAQGGSSTMFPECKKLMDAVHQKMRESANGSKCKNAENEEECRFKSLMEARHQIAEQPPEECFDQVMQFLEGEEQQEKQTTSDASVGADVSMKM